MKGVYAWINKKINSGVSRDELRETVGRFSNRDKKKVMAEKGLNEAQYKQRYDFLAKVYTVLSSEPAPRSGSCRNNYTKRSDAYQRKMTSDTKKRIVDRYGNYDNYYRQKRETERLKNEEAYDFFYGDRDYR